ncbi:hypothetical protein [Corynebacterium otitidis]|uniref:Putative secreted protein n=1 Tax=Corynebacterium otitidis ATCC 51513 TaxID=883169 RepID=I7JWQ9_9CORY|nr:hypothetical protein [Corynebacterium otitidis]EJZ81362.1 hypothetical protein HMPREF9719_01705 [Corynebacterium otitidis ATCC 51513]CCI84031.1 putative secreted protein [Corynebacterium otitidis ATCC 51513]
MSLSRALPAAAVALGLTAAPLAAAEPAPAAPPTAWAAVLGNGWLVGSDNGGQPAPALSLSKLYLGYWVLHHGEEDDAPLVDEMMRASSDAAAAELEKKYPQAIGEVIDEFRLGATSYDGRWGYVESAPADVARFLHEVRNDPVAAPLFSGMAEAEPIAADGYAQDFGTAHVPGVVGTKFGWSDERDQHSSASYGVGFVISAATLGTAEEHTAAIEALVDSAQWHEGQPVLNVDGRALPAVRAADVAERVSCVDPQGVWAATDPEILVPAFLVDHMPDCGAGDAAPAEPPAGEPAPPEEPPAPAPEGEEQAPDPGEPAPEGEPPEDRAAREVTDLPAREIPGGEFFGGGAPVTVS